MKKWREKNPWRRSYDNAKTRCKGVYAKYGRKFNMTIDDFKELWFRDKAYLMTQPSIDRIDTNGDYIKSNCRYMETDDNRCRMAKPVRQYTKDGKFVKLYKSMGRAARAFNKPVQLVSISVKM